MDDYNDFADASNWNKTVGGVTYTLLTPIACCKTVSGPPFTCATAPTDVNNNMNTVRVVVVAPFEQLLVLTRLCVHGWMRGTDAVGGEAGGGGGAGKTEGRCVCERERVGGDGGGERVCVRERESVCVREGERESVCVCVCV